jgi:hypothetical protein
MIEALEDRSLLSNLLYIGAANSNWSVAGTWWNLDTHVAWAAGAAKGDTLVFDPTNTDGGRTQGTNTNSIDDVNLPQDQDGFLNFTTTGGFNSTITLNQILKVKGTVLLDGGNNLKLVPGNAQTFIFRSAGTFTWKAGLLAVNTQFGDANNSPTVTITGGSDKTLSATITNWGQLAWQDGNLVFSTKNAQFVNDGTFDVQCDKSMNVANLNQGDPNPLFDNVGTFTKTTGGVTTMSTIVPDFTNDVTGVLQLSAGIVSFTSNLTQGQALTELSGGSLKTAKPFQINGGTLTGVGTIDGSVVNQGGNVVAGLNNAGTLNITGTYTQGANGTLIVSIGTNGLYGVLNVQGAGGVTLGGHLKEIRNDPNYKPDNREPPLTFLTYATATGDFADNNFLNDVWTAADGQQYRFQGVKNQTNYQLQVIPIT